METLTSPLEGTGCLLFRWPCWSDSLLVKSQHELKWSRHGEKGWKTASPLCHSTRTLNRMSSCWKGGPSPSNSWLSLSVSPWRTPPTQRQPPDTHRCLASPPEARRLHTWGAFTDGPHTCSAHRDPEVTPGTRKGSRVCDANASQVDFHAIP